MTTAETVQSYSQASLNERADRAARAISATGKCVWGDRVVLAFEAVRLRCASMADVDALEAYARRIGAC